MDLLRLWKEKQIKGKVLFDPNLLVIRSSSCHQEYSWGTVLYSQARENYKTEIKQSEKKISFDLKLMNNLQIAKFENLIIAANPNSLFEGHLVIYPKTKSPELSYQNISEVAELALTQPEQTFIHNMERSAASIIDWAHYQAYPIAFPIEKESGVSLGSFKGIKVYRIDNNFPTYALMAKSSDVEKVSNWLVKILELFLKEDNPHRKKIPCNFIWRNDQVWIIPRALNQSNLAANYFGGLEMGGIFCLPNADDFRSYLPDVLRKEIIEASLRCEPDTQKWFEENALRLLCEII